MDLHFSFSGKLLSVCGSCVCFAFKEDRMGVLFFHKIQHGPWLPFSCGGNIFPICFCEVAVKCFIFLTLLLLFFIRCKSYEKAKKKLTILEAPNILTIALKRFQVIFLVNDDPLLCCLRILNDF